MMLFFAIILHILLCNYIGFSSDVQIQEKDYEKLLNSIREESRESSVIEGTDSNSISSAKLGLKELGKAVSNPSLLADALKDLQDPDIMAEVKTMMKDPNFHSEMKLMMESPSFKAALARASSTVEDLKSNSDLFKSVKQDL